jgi:hypothetical protein
MISDLRFPRGLKPLIWLVTSVALIWYATIPRLGHRRPSMSGLAFEVLLTFAILALSAVALVSAVMHLSGGAPFWSRLYSRLTLWIVGGVAGLVVTGYFQLASQEAELGHYSLAPLVLLASGVAVVPVLIGEVAGMRRRGGD